MHTKVHLSTPILRTPRVMQVEGLFDLPPAQQSAREWEVTLPVEDRPWHVGLIVGPSGCGKSTVARALFGSEALRPPDWPDGRAVVDAFPPGLPVKDLVALLSAVGFSSPPAWLRPFRALSTGEQFRVNLARLLAEAPALAVADEFTSVVDRTVARVGSAAVARAVRGRGGRFVAVTCHEDVEEWLCPDWLYRPATNAFAWRSLRRRPAIVLRVARVPRSAWGLFRHHHYLSGALSPFAVCFAAFWDGLPVAFSAWLAALTARGGRREHRTVTLPDYQGVGIGMALSGYCASVWKGLGYRVTSTTTHPAYLAARRRSADWRMTRPPSLVAAARRGSRLRHATNRLTAGFEYVGPGMEPSLARRFVDAERKWAG